MKKKVFSILFTFLILYCIYKPAIMANAIGQGLILWYQSILPTLLPFSIFSNIIIHSGLYDQILQKIHPITRRIYPISSTMVYPLIAGFLFGFPLGSKICADLYMNGKTTKQECHIIASVCNNYGPAFLYNFVYTNIFFNVLHPVHMYLSCYLPPLILGRIWLSYMNRQNTLCYAPTNKHKKPTSRSQINIKIIDAGIMDGFTTMIKLAGYIILSTLVTTILLQISHLPSVTHAVLTGLVEITNGIAQVSLLNNTTLVKGCLSIAIINFGGVSGLCQTYSMMKSTGFPLKNYLYFKSLCSLLGIVITWFFFIIK